MKSELRKRAFPEFQDSSLFLLIFDYLPYYMGKFMSFEELLKDKNGVVYKAYETARKAHAGVRRFNGEPYFNHSVAVARELAEWGLDENTVAAGLLHDVAEDTAYGLENIGKDFGEEIAFLVDGVTKIGRVKYRGQERQIESIRKMILAMAEDLRVVLIRLADRHHNMRTLSALPAPKQRRIAQETMEIYAPLAYRLGMQRLSGELEDLAFPYLYPNEYKWIIHNLKYHYEEREKYLNKVKPLVEKALAEGGIKPFLIDFRAKRYSSLYKKLLKYDMDISKIYDLVAFRIIVGTVEECYATLGIIHKLWPPLPGRIKDYIAMPKPNGYRSLHTTVLCLDKQIVEFQIRTEEMHREAENGIAAHWAYEQSKGSKQYARRQASVADSKEIAWVEKLRSWQQDFSDSKEFMDALKIDFFKDRIFAMTPVGEIVDLPDGATPVDFAYQIHTDIGDQCVGAKVNGKIVPLDYKLRSQDIVEIITQKNKKPSPAWLQFAITSKAKSHIRSASKNKDVLLKSRLAATEFKIIALDRIGLLKDVTSAVSRSHINIQSSSSSSFGRGNLQLLKIKCDVIDKSKVSKLLIKLKGIEGIKEIDWRTI
ncbi:MAG: RelA/SpoT family protein [Patescibacteria group bacterium]|nr:RelA/SpoT family protein [Patescibacteria group bacterium]